MRMAAWCVSALTEDWILMCKISAYVLVVELFASSARGPSIVLCGRPSLSRLQKPPQYNKTAITAAKMTHVTKTCLKMVFSTRTKVLLVRAAYILRCAWLFQKLDVSPGKPSHHMCEKMPMQGRGCFGLSGALHQISLQCHRDQRTTWLWPVFFLCVSTCLARVLRIFAFGYRNACIYMVWFSHGVCVCFMRVILRDAPAWRSPDHLHHHHVTSWSSLPCSLWNTCTTTTCKKIQRLSHQPHHGGIRLLWRWPITSGDTLRRAVFLGLEEPSMAGVDDAFRWLWEYAASGAGFPSIRQQAGCLIYHPVSACQDDPMSNWISDVCAHAGVCHGTSAVHHNWFLGIVKKDVLERRGRKHTKAACVGWQKITLLAGKQLWMRVNQKSGGRSMPGISDHGMKYPPVFTSTSSLRSRRKIQLTTDPAGSLYSIAV
jgi:hypothetical protein